MSLCPICVAAGRVYCPPEHHEARADGIVAEWVEPTMMVAYVNIEHTKLKDAVVAAEAWWLKSFGPTRAIEAENDLVKTVDVLIKFEKENNL
jgi:hypothetical protein